MLSKSRVRLAAGQAAHRFTHVISAVRDLDRLELAGKTCAPHLEALATAALAWLACQIYVTEFAERYGRALTADGFGC